MMIRLPWMCTLLLVAACQHTPTTDHQAAAAHAAHAGHESSHPVAGHAADAHDHGSEAIALPAVPAQRWAVDTAQHRGMQGIADAAATARHAHDRGRFDAAQAEKLAVAIDEGMRYMLAHCTLEPQADAVLHVFLARLTQAAASAKHDPKSSDGLGQLIATLDRYADYFDDPQWKWQREP